MKFVTWLKYEYTHVTVDLFYENLTLFHSSVVVCNHILPFFLYLKECVVMCACVELIKTEFLLHFLVESFVHVVLAEVKVVTELVTLCHPH